MITPAWSEWDAEQFGFIFDPRRGLKIRGGHSLSIEATAMLVQWLKGHLRAAPAMPDTDTQWR